MASPKGGVALSLSKSKLKRSGLAVLVLIVVIVGGYFLWQWWPKALVIEDAQADWDGSNMGADSNLNPYKIDYIDIKSVSLKTSGDNLVVRWDFYGTIPKLPVDDLPAINGDKITDINYNLRIDTDNNMATGPSTGLSEIMLHNVDTGSAKQMETWVKVNGVRKDEDSIISGGGKGHDYVETKFPLSTLGLKKGQKVTVLAVATLGTEKKGEFASVDRVANPYEMNGDSQYIQMYLGERLVLPVNGVLTDLKFAK